MNKKVEKKIAELKKNKKKIYINLSYYGNTI